MNRRQPTGFLAGVLVALTIAAYLMAGAYSLGRKDGIAEMAARIVIQLEERIEALQRVCIGDAIQTDTSTTIIVGPGSCTP